MLNILLTGVGGQGTVLAAKVLAQAALEKGWQVRTAETIGMAQRGGNVVSHVRIGNKGEQVLAPLVSRGTADLIICVRAGRGRSRAAFPCLYGDAGVRHHRGSAGDGGAVEEPVSRLRRDREHGARADGYAGEARARRRCRAHEGSRQAAKVLNSLRSPRPCKPDACPSMSKTFARRSRLASSRASWI